MAALKYLSHYHHDTQTQVRRLIELERLEAYLLNKYPAAHTIKTDKALFDYVNNLKNSHIKKSSPLSKVLYDGKISVIHNALGTHHMISRVQGGKLKTKNEIRVATLFKNTPEAFLRMIVVHELAHFKEKGHNKAFYQLCTHMEPAYHQFEFDLRVYLTYIDLYKNAQIWS
jgi:hypothetical protein